MKRTSGPAPYLIFDFTHDDNVVEHRAFVDPIQVIIADCIEEVQPALQMVQSFVDQGYYAAGFLSYEASPAFDSAYEVTNHQDALPLVWFGIYSHISTYSRDDLDDAQFDVSPWIPGTSAQDYENHLVAIKAALSRGDSYQVNYTMKLSARFRGDDLAYYEHLRAAQKAKYSAYLDLGNLSILSLSPELFFRLDSGCVTTRPMKGTVRRGRWLAQDEELKAWLQESEKNRAENIMIVDLLRNDLSNIAGASSVHVTRLCDVEQYPTVHQMTSTVVANVPIETTFVDVMKALFPCGSITGAPKISTMRLIKQLENSPRGVYCGSIGYIEPGGRAVFNVAIRTILLNKETGYAEYGVGGGVTFDSTIEDEYEEALLKAAVLQAKTEPFDLLETLKLDHGEYWLVDRHVQRLVESAAYFSIPIDPVEIYRLLQKHARCFPDSLRRVRLTVSQTGIARIESAALPLPKHGVYVVSLAKSPISRDNYFLYHKTTQRTLYLYHKSLQPQAFDVLLWNEAGEITEFTSGNVVVKIGQSLWTPPRDSGLLAGTLRAQLLEEGIIRERRLMHEDVPLASQVWFINSVRGWVPVQFV